MILGYILGFVALRNRPYCHPIPSHTPVLTVSTVVLVLWVRSGSTWHFYTLHSNLDWLSVQQKGVSLIPTELIISNNTKHTQPHHHSIQACQPQSGAIAWDCISKWGNFWLNDNIYETGENGAKISSISHSFAPILVGQLRESHSEILRVGRPDSIGLALIELNGGFLGGLERSATAYLTSSSLVGFGCIPPISAILLSFCVYI